jgi:hypothetical protein
VAKVNVRFTRDLKLDVDTLFQVLTEVKYNEEKFKYLGYHEIEVKKNTDGETIYMESSWVLGAIPSPFDKFLNKNKLLKKDVWKKLNAQSYTCRFETTFPGGAIYVLADMNIKGIASNMSSFEMVGSCESKIPLVGGRIADYAAQEMPKSLLKEFEFLYKYKAIT